MNLAIFARTLPTHPHNLKLPTSYIIDWVSKILRQKIEIKGLLIV